jgi:hypothetical protein
MGAKTSVFRPTLPCRGLFTAARAVLLSCVLLTANYNAVFAQDSTIRNAPIIPLASDAEVGRLAGKASEYARTGQGVSIIIVLGDDAREQGYSADEIAEAFQLLFSDHGTQSKAFTVDADTPATATTFLTKNNVFGPNNIQKAMESVSSAVDEHKKEKFLDELHVD